MQFLLDTHILLWAAADDPKLTKTARALIEDQQNTLFFSAASIWEVAIKATTKSDFAIDPTVLRRALVDSGYAELGITGQHAAMVRNLPSIHNDPFDRILIAQAMVEGIELVTGDRKIAQYPGPIRSL